MKLTDKIYGYFWQGNGNNCNTYLYAGKKNLLIDPGHVRNEFGTNCLQVLANSMAKDGFNFENMDLILCTHSHPDHCEGAAELQEKYGLSMAMHRDEEGHMETLCRFYERMTGTRPRLPSIDIYLEEGELELGLDETEKLQALLTPGHSPGSLSFYFPGEKALVTGDAVFYGSIGRTDFPDGSLKLLGGSVNKLAAIPDVEWVLPGHMQPVKGRENVLNNYRMIKQMFF